MELSAMSRGLNKVVYSSEPLQECSTPSFTSITKEGIAEPEAETVTLAVMGGGEPAEPFAMHFLRHEVLQLFTALRVSNPDVLSFRFWDTPYLYGEEGDPFCAKLAALYRTLEHEEAVVLQPFHLRPFLDILGVPETGGSITAAVLYTLRRLLALGSILPLKQSSASTINALVDGVLQTKFHGSRKAQDEVVLLALLNVLEAAVIECPAGRLLTDKHIVHIIETCYQIGRQPRASEVIRHAAQHAVEKVCSTVFQSFNRSPGCGHAGTREAPQEHVDFYGAVCVSEIVEFLATLILGKTKPPKRISIENEAQLGAANSQKSAPCLLEATATVARPHSHASLSSPTGPFLDSLGRCESHVWACNLLNLLLEICGEEICKHPLLLKTFRKSVLPSLLLAFRTSSIPLVASILRCTLNMYHFLRLHLKTPLAAIFEVIYLGTVVPRFSSQPLSTEEKDRQNLVFLSLLHLCKQPMFVLELYENYDCHASHPNFFARLMTILTQAVEWRTFRCGTLVHNGGLPESPEIFAHAVDDTSSYENDRLPREEDGTLPRVSKTARGHALLCLVWILRTLSEWEKIPHMELSQERDRMDKLFETKRLKTQMEKAAHLFNTKGSKDVVSLLQELGLFDTGPISPPTMVHFLRKHPGLDSRRIGEYLAGVSVWHVAVREAFVNSFFFKGLRLVAALRLFLSTFKLPGEAQQIDRLMEAFAQRYFKCQQLDVVSCIDGDVIIDEPQSAEPTLPFEASTDNNNSAGPSRQRASNHTKTNCESQCSAESKANTATPTLYKTADCIFILSFSIIMLNTDLHNANIRHKMTPEGFLRNNRGINKGDDLPDAYLLDIYRDIQREPIRFLPDLAADPSITSSAVKEYQATTGCDDVDAWVHFVTSSDDAIEQYDVVSPLRGQHEVEQLQMLRVILFKTQALQRLFLFLSGSTDPALMKLSLDGIVALAKLAASHQIQSVVTTVMAFLTASFAYSLTLKTALAIEAIFHILPICANQFCDITWVLLVECVLRLSSLGLLSDGVQNSQPVKDCKGKLISSSYDRCTHPPLQVYISKGSFLPPATVSGEHSTLGLPTSGSFVTGSGIKKDPQGSSASWLATVKAYLFLSNDPESHNGPKFVYEGGETETFVYPGTTVNPLHLGRYNTPPTQSSKCVVSLYSSRCADPMFCQTERERASFESVLTFLASSYCPYLTLRECLAQDIFTTQTLRQLITHNLSSGSLHALTRALVFFSLPPSIEFFYGVRGNTCVIVERRACTGSLYDSKPQVSPENSLYNGHGSSPFYVGIPSHHPLYLYGHLKKRSLHSAGSTIHGPPNPDWVWMNLPMHSGSSAPEAVIPDILGIEGYRLKNDVIVSLNILEAVVQVNLESHIRRRSSAAPQNDTLSTPSSSTNETSTTAFVVSFLEAALNTYAAGTMQSSITDGATSPPTSVDQAGGSTLSETLASIIALLKKPKETPCSLPPGIKHSDSSFCLSDRDLSYLESLVTTSLSVYTTFLTRSIETCTTDLPLLKYARTLLSAVHRLPLNVLIYQEHVIARCFSEALMALKVSICKPLLHTSEPSELQEHPSFYGDCCCCCRVALEEAFMGLLAFYQPTSLEPCQTGECVPGSFSDAIPIALCDGLNLLVSEASFHRFLQRPAGFNRGTNVFCSTCTEELHTAFLFSFPVLGDCCPQRGSLMEEAPWRATPLSILLELLVSLVAFPQSFPYDEKDTSSLPSQDLGERAWTYYLVLFQSLLSDNCLMTSENVACLPATPDGECALNRSDGNRGERPLPSLISLLLRITGRISLLASSPRVRMAALRTLEEFPSSVLWGQQYKNVPSPRLKATVADVFEVLLSLIRPDSSDRTIVVSPTNARVQLASRYLLRHWETLLEAPDTADSCCKGAVLCRALIRYFQCVVWLGASPTSPHQLKDVCREAFKNSVLVLALSLASHPDFKTCDALSSKRVVVDTAEPVVDPNIYSNSATLLPLKTQPKEPSMSQTLPVLKNTNVVDASSIHTITSEFSPTVLHIAFHTLLSYPDPPAVTEFWDALEFALPYTVLRNPVSHKAEDTASNSPLPDTSVSILSPVTDWEFSNAHSSLAQGISLSNPTRTDDLSKQVPRKTQSFPTPQATRSTTPCIIPSPPKSVRYIPPPPNNFFELKCTHHCDLSSIILSDVLSSPSDRCSGGTY